ncbi:hypothetical protein GCM10020331_010740 [Ectobacillus funiculus]
MRTDLVTTYERIILKKPDGYQKNGLILWYKNKWLEQPPLAPSRNEIAKEKNNKKTIVLGMSK